jgi:deazaflavin-dependent oxidoreductase (nitroreductase family)
VGVPDVDAALPFAYLTTTGRRTGRPHRIEIWFGVEGGGSASSSAFLLAGGGRSSDWVANLEADPAVTIEIGPSTWSAVARVVTDDAEAATARRLLCEKYQPTYDGDLAGWRDSALPVAVDLPDR